LVFIPVLNIIGYILLLVVIHDIFKAVQKRSIFNNAIIAVGVEIVGFIIGFSLILAGLFGSVLTAGMSAVIGSLAGLAVIYVMLVVASLFFRRSYSEIATSVGVKQFQTAGTLYLIGAVTLIAFGIGAIVIFVGYIFQAIAFFALPEQAVQTLQWAQPSSAGPSSPTPAAKAVPTGEVAQARRFCPSCGAPNAASAQFCMSCGQQLGPA